MQFDANGLTRVVLVRTDHAYAKGGLVDASLAVKKAGRNGDTELVHVNKEELAELIRQWGEPTINPETGLPEFFLGKIGKALKKIAKPLAKIAPIATAFIPGVGPLASAAIGAASGALSGGGLKGALLGGVTGALGSGGLGSKLGASVLGKAASPIATGALSNAVQGATTSAIQGGNPLKGALQGGVAGAASGALQGANASPASAPSQELPPVAQQASAPAAVAPASSVADAATAAKKPNFWNRDFMGLGVKNKFAVPALAVGLTALDALTKKKDDDELELPGMPGVSLPSLGVASAAPAYAARPQFYAEGGDVKAKPAKKSTKSFAVKGAGDGRDDKIPARLSDGEYVMDAETVALLGNGSSAAGAKKLDDLRVNLRKHKGKSLSKGRFSANAKKPEAYMRGGRA